MIKNKKDVIYYLANKYDLTIKEVELIVTAQFKFVAKIMSIGDFETVRLPYFGKFSVNSNRVKYINKLTNGKRNKNSSS